MLKLRSETHGARVTVLLEGRPVEVPAGFTAAAAALMHGMAVTRTSPVSGAPRGPYCMMGVCFDCLMEIDGVPNQQGCLTPVAEGMRINRQLGKRAAPR